MDNKAAEQQSVDGSPPQANFATFLATIPPNQARTISDMAIPGVVKSGNLITGHTLRLATPSLKLHCSTCGGDRTFRSDTHVTLSSKGRSDSDEFVGYLCSNCRTQAKTFALKIVHTGNRESNGIAYKYGEVPIFGTPTPPRLLKLLGDQRSVFLAGRRCENQGLGIGAFAYYRRVVENLKNRILDEIAAAAKKIEGAGSDELLESITAAKTETRFSQSLSMVKDAIPQSLLIDGHHNPLTLLHSALSKGLHAETDAHCLEMAQSIRIVLSELAERLNAILKTDAELTTAISRLLRPDSPEEGADVQ